MAAVSIGALAEILVSRIELRADGLLVSTLFGKRFIARHEIESVTWKSVANSVRAWIGEGNQEHHE